MQWRAAAQSGLCHGRFLPCLKHVWRSFYGLDSVEGGIVTMVIVGVAVDIDIVVMSSLCRCCCCFHLRVVVVRLAASFVASFEVISFLQKLTKTMLQSKRFALLPLKFLQKLASLAKTRIFWIGLPCFCETGSRELQFLQKSRSDRAHAVDRPRVPRST